MGRAFVRNIWRLNLSAFNINPFTVKVLARVFGEYGAENMAKALVYPRILWTSASTTTWTVLQKMCVDLLGARGASAQWMDIEFIDKTTNKLTYLQLKAWPNTINSGDVDPIVAHMIGAYNLLKTNGWYNADTMPVLWIGVLYWESAALNWHYRRIAALPVRGQDFIPVYIWNDFWHRLTWDESFYAELVEILENGAFSEIDLKETVNATIQGIAAELRNSWLV